MKKIQDIKVRTIDTAGKTDNNLGYFKIFKHELREAQDYVLKGIPNKNKFFTKDISRKVHVTRPLTTNYRADGCVQ